MTNGNWNVAFEESDECARIYEDSIPHTTDSAMSSCCVGMQAELRCTRITYYRQYGGSSEEEMLQQPPWLPTFDAHDVPDALCAWASCVRKPDDIGALER